MNVRVPIEPWKCPAEKRTTSRRRRARSSANLLARASTTAQPEASSTGESNGESWWQLRTIDLVVEPLSRQLGDDVVRHPLALARPTTSRALCWPDSASLCSALALVPADPDARDRLVGDVVLAESVRVRTSGTTRPAGP